MRILPPALACALALVAAGAQAVTCWYGLPPSNPDAAYTVHGDGTVTDTRTQLMWKQCAEGQDAQNNCAGALANMTWNAALALAEGHSFAGHTDWRLPNVKELRSLVEECNGTNINADIFPNPNGGAPSGSPFWSSTPSVSNPNSTFFVNFSNGDSTTGDRTVTYRVRLVRNAQPAPAPVLPVLSAVALQGPPASTSAAVAGTSSLAATGRWLVVPRGSTAPTRMQVKMQAASYGGITPVAQGSAAMVAGAPASFAATGLAAGTDYDFYLIADASGLLSTPLQAVPFSTPLAPIPGACGSAHNAAPAPLLASAPVVAAELCSAGTASTITSGNTAWNWDCAGSHGGGNAACAAPRGYTVSTAAGPGGSIDAAQTVAYQATPSFTATPASGYVVGAITSNCGGRQAGSSLTTAPVTAHCTVSATFKAVAPAAIPTLSQWGVLLLSLLAGLLGWRQLRAQTASGT